MMRVRRCAIVCAVASVVMAACGATGDAPEEGAGTTTVVAPTAAPTTVSSDTTVSTDTTPGVESTTSTAAPTTAPTAPGPGDFGDLRGVCGPGDVRVEPSEAGRSSDVLHIGVASDRGAELRPGLNRELWDSSVAFAAWCNDAGGIGGLQIELVDLDGALFNVEAAMAAACTDVFAMVGGGHVQDNLQFSGNDGTDFHRCGLIDVPAFAVSPDKAASNGMVQPMPNSPVVNSYAWIRDYAEVFPDEAGRGVAIVYGDVPSVAESMETYRVLVAAAGMEVVDVVPYPPLGTSDWTPLANDVIASGAGTLMFLGETGYAANLIAKLREQGFEGRALLESNMYDPLLFGMGNQAVEGSVLRLSMYPLEEADDWPAVRQYLDLLEQRTDDGRASALGMASMSAWATFALSVTECGADGNAVTRTCVLERVAERDGWTGGGLHAPSDALTSEEIDDIVDDREFCTLLVEVRDGAFVRLFPEIGSEDDDGDGFHCSTGTMVRIPGRDEVGNVDPDRPI